MNFTTKMEKLSMQSDMADLEVLQDLMLPSLAKKYDVLGSDLPLTKIFNQLEALEKAQPRGTDPAFDYKLDEFFLKWFPQIIAVGHLKGTDTMTDFKASLHAQIEALDDQYDELYK